LLERIPAKPMQGRTVPNTVRIGRCPLRSRKHVRHASVPCVSATRQCRARSHAHEASGKWLMLPARGKEGAAVPGTGDAAVATVDTSFGASDASNAEAVCR